jgi:hypothetical protein
MEWKLLTKLYGMLDAQMLAGRLEAEGIPTQMWQEGAGKAYGLTVGQLGEVHVLVPEAEWERARAIEAADYSHTLPDYDDPIWDEEVE